MPFIPVPDTVQFELIYNWSGQVCETVLHYTHSVAWTNLGMLDTANALVSWWNTNMKAWMPTNLSLTGVRATDLSSQTGPVIDANAGLPVVGTNGSPSLPNNCAVVVTKRTNLRGRSYRGRVFQPGLIELQVTDNQLSPGYITNFINAYNAAKVITTGATTSQMVVVSRYNNNFPRATGVATPVTGFTCDGVLDSQRRRLPGRGA